MTTQSPIWYQLVQLTADYDDNYEHCGCTRKVHRDFLFKSEADSLADDLNIRLSYDGYDQERCYIVEPML
jgi:hypothetical protein